MIGLVIQPPRGLDGTPQGVTTRRARIGYALAAGGATWAAVGGLLVAIQNVPAWAGWLALTLLVVTVTAWLAGAYIFHRDARKLLDSEKQPGQDRIAVLTKQATWRSAVRWPFGDLK
ncbi:MAG: hypothetical protein ACRDK4_08325 [Solirubrobacteraceae bacterium]